MFPVGVVLSSQDPYKVLTSWKIPVEMGVDELYVGDTLP